MKRIFFHLVFLTVCFAILMIVVLLTHSKIENRTTITPNGFGTVENPTARIDYELSRLQDPMTGKIPTGIRAMELKFAGTLRLFARKTSNTVWNWRGPHNVGGRTRALAIDITDENIILAGGVSGGMWRSTDGGQSFSKTTTPLQIHSTTCVVQDSRQGKTNVWYYGTGEYYGIVNAAGFSSQFSGDGIFKSTDGGQSWTHLSSTSSGTPQTLYQIADFDFVWNLVVDPTATTEDVILAAVYNGIYRSTDGGTTWAPTLGLDTSITQKSPFTDIVVTSTGVFYAAVSGSSPSKGIWRSADGLNWVDISPAGLPSNVRRIMIGLNPTDENEFYFIAQTPSSASQHRLYNYHYLSGDGTGSGGIWENRTSNLPDKDCAFFYTFNFGPYNSQSSYDMCIAVKPGNEDIVFLGGTNVYRSTDGWQSDTAWSWVGGYQCDSVTPSNYLWPNHHPDQHKFLFKASDFNVIYTANDGGLYKSVDNTSDTIAWVSLNNGYITGQFYTIAVEPGEVGSNFMVGGLQDNATFFTNNNDPNASWKSVFYGDGAYCAISHNREFYYLSWQGGKTFKFTIDDGGEVTGFTRIDPMFGGGYQFINPFLLDPNNDDVMYIAAGKWLWRNDSLSYIPLIGEEYNWLAMGWTRLQESYLGPLSNDQISTLDMSPALPNVVYYGTDGGDLFRLDYANSDTLVQTSINDTSFPGNAYVACVAANHSNGEELIACFSNYKVKSIFHSADRGETWQSISGNLEENPDGSGAGPSVAWAEMLEITPDSIIYYVGTSIGLFSTTELNGDNTVWVQEGENTIGNVVINMIEARSYDGLVAVATHGNGIYSTRFHPELAVKELVVSNLNLHQNIPNPFRKNTAIKFELKEPGKTKFDIYSIQGKKVRTLVKQALAGGKHLLKWDGKDDVGEQLLSGIYLGVMQSGHQRASISMVLMD